MSCNAPLVAWRSRDVNKSTGKRPVVFDARQGYSDLSVGLPCGRCAGCLLKKSREWAMRCAHEAQMWPVNSFVTLTYNEKHVPRERGVETLRPRDFQLFMKRLRKARPGKVRFFQCGEYGELGRPHHHCLLFNCDFGDKRVWSRRHYGCVFRSEELEKLWPFGFCEIGEANFESAGYVARYTMKKIGSEFDQLGRRRVASYLTMSRRPGVGATWFEKFAGDVFPRDEVVVEGGRRFRPPRFYDDLLERVDPVLAGELRGKRALESPGEIFVENQTAREVILRRRAADNFRRA